MNKQEPIAYSLPGEPTIYSVEPIKDCPHTTKLHSDNLLAFLTKSINLLDQHPEEKNVFNHTTCEKCLHLTIKEQDYDPEYNG